MSTAPRHDDPWTDPRIDLALRSGVPESLALYARWWQLETWLRELAYVELRACHGVLWIEKAKTGFSRQTQDAAFTHMTGADNHNPLAYLDYSQLLEAMTGYWDLFGYALLEQRSWDGRQDELKRIRHRIGHLRKPHPDDLGRLEQTLRDLERGTFIALASYNRRWEVDPQERGGTVANGWLREQHIDAQRLVRHAELQYDTRLLIRASRRPWTAWPSDLDNAAGVLWHVDFLMHERTVDARALWHDSALNAARPLLVHLLADSPWHVGFTFSAADDPQAISDAIGRVFDAVLLVSRRGNIDDEQEDRWRRRAHGVDYRVLSGSGWNIVDETTVPISNFNAGGGVQSAPEW